MKDQEELMKDNAGLRSKPHVIIEYDATQGSCSWYFDNGIPLVPLIHALELLKTMLVNSQLADMARPPERKIVVPNLSIVPPKGN